MAEYHVGCGVDKIFAGTLTKGGKYWRQNSDVTDEAIIAVIQHMYFRLDEGESSMAYAIKLNDGKYARLKLEVSDKCPEWAKEVLEAEDETKNG